MIFKLRKASDWGFESNIEINTLEELLQFVENEEKNFNNENPKSNINLFEGIILSKEEDGGWQIEIYDDYIE